MLVQVRLVESVVLTQSVSGDSNVFLMLLE